MGARKQLCDHHGQNMRYRHNFNILSCKICEMECENFEIKLGEPGYADDYAE